MEETRNGRVAADISLDPRVSEANLVGVVSRLLRERDSYRKTLQLICDLERIHNGKNREAMVMARNELQRWLDLAGLEDEIMP
jgi:hypothetical protein